MIKLFPMPSSLLLLSDFSLQRDSSLVHWDSSLHHTGVLTVAIWRTVNDYSA